MSQIYVFDPEKWLESLTRGIKEYTETGFKNSVLDNNGDPVGDQLYNVVMEWPAAFLEPEKLPMSETIISFEIDETAQRMLGFGDQTALKNYDEDLQTVKPQSAERQNVNFDWGVWTSHRAGGTTARLRAMQVMSQIFHGAQAQLGLRAATDGGDGYLEIERFSTGTFATERINDVDVFRVMGGELVICCYSRTPMPTVGTPTIEGIVYDFEIEIEA